MCIKDLVRSLLVCAIKIVIMEDAKDDLMNEILYTYDLVLFSVSIKNLRKAFEMKKII